MDGFFPKTLTRLLAGTQVNDLLADGHDRCLPVSADEPRLLELAGIDLKTAGLT